MTRKSILSVATALTILTASCGGNKENKETADNQQKETVANVDVHGQWYLENIVFSDSDYVRVRPDERLSSTHQYIVFEDSTYFIRTNCNTISDNGIDLIFNGLFMFRLPLSKEMDSGI